MAAAAGLPLAVLALIWYLPWIRRTLRFPMEFGPLLAFGCFSVIGVMLGLFLEIYSFKGETPFSRGVEGLLTLALGLAFFLITASLVAAKPDRITSWLSWIHVGAAVALAWSAVQAYYILFFQSEYPDRIRELHRLVSTHDLFIGRVTGLAYEPSWFAHQLNLLYFPLWLGSLAVGFTAFPRKAFGIPLELILVIGGAAGLVMSTSRVGLVGFLAMTGVTLLWLGFRGTQGLSSRIRQAIGSRYPSLQQIARRLSLLVVTFSLVVGFLIAGMGVILFAARLDWRWSHLFVPTAAKLFSVEYANHLLFSERAVYWMGAYGVFERFPLAGVGLGNVGFFMPETMPAFSWALPEVIEVFDPGTGLFPNAKSLWLRLLAETGIIGLSLFSVWLLVMLIRAIRLVTSSDRLRKAIGLMGILALIGALTEGFSIDSFAFPYLWISMGLVAGAGWATKGERSSPET